MSPRRRVDIDTSWARRPAAALVREVILSLVLGPIVDGYTYPTIIGREIFDGLKPPVVFAANHSSHLDTPSILRALPSQWRRKTATVAAADYFYRNRVVAGLVSLSFATVPIERSGGVSRATSERLDRLLADRWSLLLYPEGTRSRDGTMGRLRLGTAHFAIEHSIPIVPVYVSGTNAAMPVGKPWPRSHPVTLTFGQPLYPTPGESHTALTERIQQALLELQRQTSE